MIYDVEVVKSNSMNNQRTLRGSGDPRARLETHWGLLSVQEHREETLIYDFEVVKPNAMKNQKSPRGSGDPRARLETHWGLLSVQEHQEETLIYDIEVVTPNAMKNQRTLGGSGDQRPLFETSLCPLGALLDASWGTVGAYQYDMLKKQKSSATAGSGRSMPELGGNLE